MTDTNLDRAAQMAGLDDWRHVERDCVQWVRDRLKSHAATLDELDTAKAELEAFKREVSDKAAEAISIAMKAGYACERGPAISAILSSFILPKPDPLVEVVNELGLGSSKTAAEELRAALARHNLEIVEKAHD